MTKIDIFSGFLGAGKTTLIKKLIKEAFQGEKLVLIENEFGEIGIDGGFMKDAGINVTEMNSGCICCSLVGDFGAALEEVLEKYHPDRIIIEPSGVGKLSDVIKAVSGVMESHADVQMNGYVTVADATKCKMYMKNFGEFYKDQVASASTIVISRTQEMSGDKIEECVALLREENKEAAIITTPWEQLGEESIRRALEHRTGMEDLMEDSHDHHDHHDHCGCGHDHHDHDHHHHHADEIFTSWGRETAHQYTEGELEQILKALSEGEAYGTVLRAKGIIPVEGGLWKQFDLVPGEYEVREGQPDYTGRLCVIGTDLKEEELAVLFHLS